MKMFLAMILAAAMILSMSAYGKNEAAAEDLVRTIIAQ